MSINPMNQTDAFARNNVEQISVQQLALSVMPKFMNAIEYSILKSEVIPRIQGLIIRSGVNAVHINGQYWLLSLSLSLSLSLALPRARTRALSLSLSLSLPPSLSLARACVFSPYPLASSLVGNAATKPAPDFSHPTHIKVNPIQRRDRYGMSLCGEGGKKLMAV